MFDFLHSVLKLLILKRIQMDRTSYHRHHDRNSSCNACTVLGDLRATNAELNKLGFNHIVLIMGPFSSDGNFAHIKASNAWVVLVSFGY